ncbi:hypothetical protein [Fusibacillus kribbianus]|uniref:Uncharacterized protein n=1 Tax=Fusibacillus kribbianus TaxID=3044208 RepID=A0AAP4EYX0_9FIRM|nr:hypothetical protein [Ruminococcus sp. YH-rum2234]MDI9242336.1 hypothetical protein [Ruminococcus sp. YH-rum2234]
MAIYDYKRCSWLQIGCKGEVWIHGFGDPGTYCQLAVHMEDDGSVDTLLATDYTRWLYGHYAVVTFTVPDPGDPVRNMRLYNMVACYRLDNVTYTYCANNGMYVPRRQHLLP